MRKTKISALNTKLLPAVFLGVLVAVFLPVAVLTKPVPVTSPSSDACTTQSDETVPLSSRVSSYFGQMTSGVVGKLQDVLNIARPEVENSSCIFAERREVNNQEAEALSPATFFGDFESGHITGSGNHNWISLQSFTPARASLVTDARGTYARMEVRNGDHLAGCAECTERTEVLMMQDNNGNPIYENEQSATQQYAFSVKFDAGWKTLIGTNPWGTFMQLHGPDELNAKSAFALSATDKIVLNTNTGDISGNRFATHQLSDNALNKGKWINFIMTVKYAKNNTGFITIQRRNEGQTNFEEVLNLQNIPTLQYSSTVNNGNVGGHYIKMGLYRNQQSFPSVLYIDGFTRAKVTATSSDCRTGSTLWNNASFASQTGSFTASFDATPKGTNIDAVTGLSAGASDGYTDLAAIVRFSNNNIIEARNGGDYASASSIPYIPNRPYHFRLVINVPAHTYSAYVTPQGDTEKTIGLNYRFRSEQSGVNHLANKAIVAPVGSHSVCNFAINGATPPPTPTPTPLPNPTPTPTPLPNPTPTPTPTPTSTAIIINHNSVDTFNSLSSSDIANAKKTALMLRHASIGWQISVYMGELKKANSNLDFSNVAFQERGNPGWKEKVDDFVAQVNAHVNDFDAFSMKFCFVDPDADWAYYRDAMLNLEAKYPTKKFIWWTHPVKTTGESTPTEFNKQLRAFALANKKIVYDLADIQSEGAKDSNGYEIMKPANSSDGGHLSGYGGDRAAKAFWVMLASIY